MLYIFQQSSLNEMNKSKQNKQKVKVFFEMSKNFIRQNIENIKGTRRPVSIIENEFKSKLSVSKTKKKYNNITSQYKQPSVINRVVEMQKKIDEIERNRSQSLLISQISQIKDDIKLIKSHLIDLKRSSVYHQERLKTQSSGDEQNIYIQSGTKGRLRSHGSQHSVRQDQKSKVTSTKYHQVLPSKSVTLQDLLSQNQKKHLNSKRGLSIKAIYPVLKQYKLQGPQYGTTFYGYSKRNSQPVAIKYFPSIQLANQVIEIYDKLWKNIAKARWPCINRIYDYKIQQNNFIIMQKNINTIVNLPYKLIILDIFKSLEFIHDCGYLYRNIQPEHFMLNQQGQLTIIDFQRAKKYIDMKQHYLDVSDNMFNGSVFASNNQIRGLSQGRKDDLEALGYFALLLMGYDIPWYGLNKEATIKIRSTITLQQLFKGHQAWIEYMATVMRTARNEKPDYRKLQSLLESL